MPTHKANAGFTLIRVRVPLYGLS